MVRTERKAVVDASAIAAILFDEPAGPEVVSRCQGFTLIAPSLIRSEVVSVGLKKLRADARSLGAIERGLRRYFGFQIREIDISPEAVLKIAQVTDLSGYDASYLWLALSQRAKLITLDKELATAFAATLP